MYTSELQTMVYESVKARGYTDGFLPEQFAARQIAKLGEELGEFADCFTNLPPYVAMDVQMNALTCRGNFDAHAIWFGAQVANREQAAKELADIAVVLLCAAQALGVDVLAMAAQKAAADVQRGVRK